MGWLSQAPTAQSSTLIGKYGEYWTVYDYGTIHSNEALNTTENDNLEEEPYRQGRRHNRANKKSTGKLHLDD